VQARVVIALFTLAVVLHWPTGQTDFVYDDIDFVVKNASVQSLDAVGLALHAPFPPDQPERGLYRPLTTLVYALEYAAFGAGARGYHLVSTLLYGVLVVLVYRLASVWFGAASGSAAAAALLFAIHPVHCDVVDTVAGQSELLALSLAVASLVLFLRANPPGDDPPARLARLGSALLYLLACGAKETAVLLPVVLGLHLLARDGAPAGATACLRRIFDRTSAHLGVTLIYFAGRYDALGGFGPAQSVLEGIEPVAKAATVGAVFSEYLRLLLYPDVLQLDFYYQQAIGLLPAPTLASVVGWLAAAFLVGGSAAATLGALRGRPTSLASPRGGWIAGVGTGLVFLLPVSHLFSIGALMAERFLFAPSLGFILFVTSLGAYGLQRTTLDPKRQREVALVVLAALAVSGGLRSHTRASEWRDGVALWSALARKTPNDYRPYSNAATHWIERERFDEAYDALQRAQALAPGDAAVRTNLAIISLHRGRLDEAEGILRALLAEDPADHYAWLNLGAVELQRGRASRALAYLERALDANPYYEPARQQTAMVRQQLSAARRFLLGARTVPPERRDAAFRERLAKACRLTESDECGSAFRSDFE
jgi:hypothetical protein